MQGCSKPSDKTSWNPITAEFELPDYGLTISMGESNDWSIAPWAVLPDGMRFFAADNQRQITIGVLEIDVRDNVDSSWKFSPAILDGVVRALTRQCVEGVKPRYFSPRFMRTRKWNRDVIRFSAPVDLIAEGDTVGMKYQGYIMAGNRKALVLFSTVSR